MVDYEGEGLRLKAFGKAVIRNSRFYGNAGYTYTEVASGAFGVRALNKGCLFDARSPGIFPMSEFPHGLVAALNSRFIGVYFRLLSPGILLDQAYAPKVPIPSQQTLQRLESSGEFAISVKQFDACSDPCEFTFKESSKEIYTGIQNSTADITSAILLSSESYNDRVVKNDHELGVNANYVLQTMGTPAGFYPLITGYDALPELPADVDLPSPPQEVLDYLAMHERINPGPTELARLKLRLRALYEAGPGAKQDAADEEVDDDGDDGEEIAVSGAHIPIPTETFLEELSIKMQLHPISVYWLLEELRAEGARCKPEERRLLEDRLSVLVLRLLGHRWPKQIEANEPVPAWADPDGIIPISGGTGDTTLAEQVRARLRAEDGELGAQRTEALLAELTGSSLETWLRREFWKRHVRQFKYRPIAWHLASDPSVATGGKRRGANRQPAFECLLYYHACSGDVLARNRTQYVEPLLRAERQHLDAARRANNDDTTAAQATARIQELEAFAAKLRDVAENGFASPELDKLLADETLDRWNGDGYLAPATHDDLVRQERAWHVDLNDGVRVNIAPLQLAGLLHSDVLKAADAKKAIADRARWRSDERRWVRAGKLPRCGWMPDDVPESLKWTELEPQRDAERIKLAQKRQKALNRVQEDPASE